MSTGTFEITWIDGKFESPPGEVCFCNLSKPQGFQGSKPKYELSIQWDNSDPAFQKFKQQIDAEDKKYIEGTLKKKWKGNTLWKEGSTYDRVTKTRDDDPNKTKVAIRMNARPSKDGSLHLPEGFMGCFTTNKTPTDDPRSGDIITVGFSLGGINTSMRRGVKIYPKIVKVVERRGGGGGGSVDSWFPDTNTATKANDDSDDLPAVNVDDLV